MLAVAVASSSSVKLCSLSLQLPRSSFAMRCLNAASSYAMLPRSSEEPSSERSSDLDSVVGGSVTPAELFEVAAEVEVAALDILARASLLTAAVAAAMFTLLLPLLLLLLLTLLLLPALLLMAVALCFADTVCCCCWCDPAVAWFRAFLEFESAGGGGGGNSSTLCLLVNALLLCDVTR
jgi:hypothetical protein